jgi:hypothetical protein
MDQLSYRRHRFPPPTSSRDLAFSPVHTVPTRSGPWRAKPDPRPDPKSWNARLRAYRAGPLGAKSPLQLDLPALVRCFFGARSARALAKDAAND